MEQLSLDVFNKETTDEERLLNELKECIQNADYEKHLSIAKNKDATISIKAKSILVAKVKLQGKKQHIELREKYKSYFENQDYEEITNSLGEWIRIPIKSIDDVLSIKETLSAIYVLVLADFGGESFGCCSRYEKCSDAKQCVHPDKITAMACGYRKNLEKGKIFYGKNKNI